MRRFIKFTLSDDSSVLIFNRDIESVVEMGASDRDNVFGFAYREVKTHSGARWMVKDSLSEIEAKLNA